MANGAQNAEVAVPDLKSALGSVAFSALDLPLAHKAIRQPDGKVLVPDVPIFVETTERQGQEQPFNRAWLLRAQARQQAQPGYWAPMHFHHNTAGKDRERAGDFAITATRLRIVEGKPRWVSFASLRFDSEAIFKRALEQFPYRSVEVSRDKPDEINSLALLSSEAPFHRLPNLVAFAADEKGATFSWRTRLMADLIDNPADELLASLEAETPGAEKKPTETKAESDKKDDSDGPMSRKEFLAFAKKMEAAIAKLGEDKSPHAAKHEADDEDADKHEADDEDADKHEADDEKKKPAASPVAAASATRRGATRFDSDDSLKVTKLEAEKDAFEARLQAIEEERKIEKLSSTFRAELAPYGEHHVKKGLAILAEKGEEHARLFADTIKATVRPVARGPVARTSFAAEADEPRELAPYATDNAGNPTPDRLRKARTEAQHFAAMPAASRGELTLASYLRYQVGEV